MKPILFFLLTLFSLQSVACPFCNSTTARQIRASLFGEDVWFNLAITVLPFVLFAAIAFFIYHGGLPAKKTTKTGQLNQQS
jgi:hypothetical protein